MLRLMKINPRQARQTSQIHVELLLTDAAIDIPPIDTQIKTITNIRKADDEHQLQEGGDVFGHFLSNIDSQKKAIAKKKALEKVYIYILLILSLRIFR